MDVFRAYTIGTSAYLSLQSLPLLLTPKLIVNLLASEPRQTTDVESYFSRSLGLALFTLAVICILLTGILPVSSQIAAAQEEDGDSSTIRDPYAYPTVLVTSTYHALSAFYLYTQVAYGFTFGFGVGLIASTALFCMGLWVLLFGSEKGRISKTGADKRTSNFPFENKESAKEKKKESKRKSVSSKSR